MKNYAKKFNLSTDMSIRIHDLSSEVGELQKAYLQATNYGDDEFVVTENFQEELGDILFTLKLITNELELDQEELFKNTVKKYKKRFNLKGHIGSK